MYKFLIIITDGKFHKIRVFDKKKSAKVLAHGNPHIGFVPALHLSSCEKACTDRKLPILAHGNPHTNSVQIPCLLTCGRVLLVGTGVLDGPFNLYKLCVYSLR